MMAAVRWSRARNVAKNLQQSTVTARCWLAASVLSNFQCVLHAVCVCRRPPSRWYGLHSHPTGARQ